MASREEILEAIRQIASEDGKPPGRQQFETRSGIAFHEWYGVHWARWGDAVEEAGFAKNALQGPISEDALLQPLRLLTERLGHFPTNGDIRLEGKRSEAFPGHTTFNNRLGPKTEQLRKLISFCQSRGYDTVQKCNLEASLEEARARSELRAVPEEGAEMSAGFVYLVKSGKAFKIGATVNPDRRMYEIGMQLPDKLELIHSIETDDAYGIEAYWHRRFKDRHRNGEWFDLTPADVRAFKRRKFM